MRRRAAGNDDDLLDAFGKFLSQVQLWQVELASFKIHPACNRIGQRAHLLVDFLLHKVAIFALLCRHRVPGHGGDFISYRLAVQRLDAGVVAPDYGHLAGFKENDVTCVF